MQSQNSDYNRSLAITENQLIDLQEIKTLVALVFTCLNKTSKITNYIKQEESFIIKDFDAQRFIKNFSKVDDKYYRGAAPGIEGIEYLIECERMRTIIDLRYMNKKDRQKQEKIAAEAGLNYINIAMIPIFPPSLKQINQFFSIVNNKENHPVYVHCREGKDRTGIMTALYRIKNYEYNFDKAFGEMIKFGHHTNLFPLLKIWLYKYIEGKNTQLLAS